MTDTTKDNLIVAALSWTIAVPGMIYQAWVLVTLWRWFLEPLVAYPAPAVTTVAGALTIYRLITTRRGPEKPDQTAWARFGELISVIAIPPTLALFIGYGITLFQ